MTRLSQPTPTRVSSRQRASFVTRRTSEGVIASYIHHNGRLGVLIEVNCETERGARAPELSALARDLAEHVAAAAPLAVRYDDLSADLVAKRRREFEDELRAHGKPEQLLDGFVDVKMRAYLKSIVLLDQKSIREPAISIAQLIDQVSSSIGETVQVRRFARFHMGLA
jgi:elongation factor Ts